MVSGALSFLGSLEPERVLDKPLWGSGDCFLTTPLPLVLPASSICTSGMLFTAFTVPTIPICGTAFMGASLVVRGLLVNLCLLIVSFILVLEGLRISLGDGFLLVSGTRCGGCPSVPF